jgi:7-cyano-7-deazaguanine synthase in queuosine biosynthesis
MDAHALSLDVPENPDRKLYDEQRAQIEASFLVVVPWSGGLDSTASLILACHEYPHKQVVAMPMNFQQPWDNAESRNRSFLIDQLWTRHIAPNFLPTISMPPAEESFDHIQVGRNFAVTNQAAHYIQQRGWGEVWLSWYGGEIPLAWGDKSVAALSEMNRYPECRVHTPWRHQTKGHVLNWLISHGYIEVAKQTYSCFTGQNVPCGRCRACWNTYVAWEANGLGSTMVLPWLIHAQFSEIVRRYRQALADRPQDYGSARTGELTRAMEAWQAIKEATGE